jgi:hypothetical protein
VWLIFLCNLAVFHCLALLLAQLLALLLAQLLAQAITVNYVVDKNPTETIKFRFTEPNKNINFQKNNFTKPTKFNFFLHLKLTICVFKMIT